MIAHGAEHPRLQISKGHCIGKAASVDLSVVVTVRIAAVDEYVVTPVASHTRERNGLVVKQQVRDRPGHSPSKRSTEGVSKSPYSLGLKIRGVALLDVVAGCDYAGQPTVEPFSSVLVCGMAVLQKAGCAWTPKY
jgi:hypothetical protein